METVKRALGAVAMSALMGCVAAQSGKPVEPPVRARDLGVPFEGTPGALNAITDVAGVLVGHVTLIKGQGALKVGKGPVRTGVTVVVPRGRDNNRPVHAGFYNLNGNGEMTGLSYVQDYGIAYGPIGLSNTNAIGEVYAGIQRWTSKRFGEALWPVVAETWDGALNDLEGFHVTPAMTIKAIDAATGGPVAEGNVGGGTGMRCFGFKGGIGTASRVFEAAGQTYTLGALVQCNTGERNVLRIAGVPVGAALADRYLSCYDPKMRGQTRTPLCQENDQGGEQTPDQGSIIIIVATDAPLTPVQLDRVARRASLALGRLGSYSGNGSGDLVLAFSTDDAVNDVDDREVPAHTPFPTGQINPVFKATVEATEEAIVNALVAARTMTGINGRRLYGLPHDELSALLRQYGR